MKKKNSLNLIKIFKLKEAHFWKRTLTMKDEVGWFGFCIGILFITIFHYMFAGMHFLFESWVWLTNRNQYKQNLNKMYAQVVG